MIARWVVLCAAALGPLAVAAPALGWAHTEAPGGGPAAWRPPEIAFRVGAVGVEDPHERRWALRGIRRGIEAWGDTAGVAARLQAAGPIEGAWAPANGHSELVYLRAGWPPELGSPELVGGVSLLTFEGGAIVEGDAAFNAETYRFAPEPSAPDALDLWRVATHELGHLLGLAHPCGGVGLPSCGQAGPELLAATMYPAAQPGSVARRLPASDDLAGLEALYGLDPQASVGASAAPRRDLCLGQPLRLATPSGVRALRQLDAHTLKATALPWPAPAGWSTELLGEGLWDLELTNLAGRTQTLFGAVQIRGCALPSPPGSSGGCGAAPGATGGLALTLVILLLASGRRRRLGGLTLRAGAVALLLCSSLAPAPASAFVRSTVPGGGPCLWWGARELGYRVHQDLSGRLSDGGDLAAVQGSFEAWGAESCSDLSFRFDGVVASPLTGYSEEGPNTNLVVWRVDGCEVVAPLGDACHECARTGGECCSVRYNCWEHPDLVIGVTTTTFIYSTGELLDADIELNAGDFWFTNVDAPLCSDPSPIGTCDVDAECAQGLRCFQGSCLREGCVRTDVRNAVTHEAGHLFGLGHTSISSATMYANAFDGELAKRDLHLDDREGLCTIYPARAPTLLCLDGTPKVEVLEQVHDLRGCGGCAAAGAGSWGLALGLLILGLYRRPVREEAGGDGEGTGHGGR